MFDTGGLRPRVMAITAINLVQCQYRNDETWLEPRSMARNVSERKIMRIAIAAYCVLSAIFILVVILCAEFRGESHRMHNRTAAHVTGQNVPRRKA